MFYIAVAIAVPEEHQHKVLTFGILVALVLWAIFIARTRGHPERTAHAGSLRAHPPRDDDQPVNGTKR